MILSGNVISRLCPPPIRVRTVYIFESNNNLNCAFAIHEIVANSTSLLNFNHWCVFMKLLRKKTNTNPRNVSQNAVSPYVT